MSLNEASRQLNVNPTFLHGCAIGLGFKPETVGRSLALTADQIRSIKKQIDRTGGIAPRLKRNRKPRPERTAV